MISAEDFTEAARRRGFALYTGVPCSYLKPLINFVADSSEMRYVAAANEGDAVAIAAGAEVGGRPSVAMFQNSGLGNAVNPLTSLTYTSQIPILLVTTLRGDSNGSADEPQHRLMGAITTRLLELMCIRWAYFPATKNAVPEALDRAVDHLHTHRTPYALVLRKGTICAARAPRPRRPRPVSVRPELSTPPLPVCTRSEMLRTIQRCARPSDVVIATTGHIGRELYAAGDRDNQFYMVGAMGCASSFGLGLAISQPKRRVIVVDGDGAILMRMGALATIGQERPDNLVHVVLDNQAHESTGGQATASCSTDLGAVAAACGYARVLRARTAEELADCLHRSPGGVTFVHVRIVAGSSGELPRPALGPDDVARRLSRFLCPDR